MRSFGTSLLILSLLTAAPAVTEAASLQVAPVRIEVPPKQAATKVMLRNTGEDEINAQIRVFKWVQVKGKDQLVETRDVVASPPIVKLMPNKGNTIRIVRTAKTPVQAEEAYRLLVDQLPPPANKPGMAISLVLRYSIPVFFNATNETGTQLNWTVEARGGQTVLTVTNKGDTHLRLAGLSMQTGKSAPQSFGPGLVGYVLGNSTARFSLRGALKGAKPGSTVLISAEGNDGPVQAKAEFRAAN